MATVRSTSIDPELPGMLSAGSDLLQDIARPHV